MRTKTDHTYFLKLAASAINGTRCAPPYVLEWEGSIPGNPECYASIEGYRFMLAPSGGDNWRGRFRLTIDARPHESITKFEQFYEDATCAFIEAEYMARALTRKRP